MKSCTARRMVVAVASTPATEAFAAPTIDRRSAPGVIIEPVSRRSRREALPLRLEVRQ